MTTIERRTNVSTNQTAEPDAAASTATPSGGPTRHAASAPRDHFESAGVHSNPHANTLRRAMGSSAPPAPSGSMANHRALVQQAIANGGNLPELPPLPALPTRSGAEIVRMTGLHAFASRGALDRAEHDRAAYGHHGLIGSLALSGTHAALDVGGVVAEHALSEGVLEFLEANGAMFGLETAGAGLVAFELGEGMWHELENLAEGHTVPSQAVIDSLRQEVQQATQRVEARLEREASANYALGRNAAIDGRPPSAEQMRRPDVALGYREGAAYRAQNRALVEQHAERNRALSEARATLTRTEPQRDANAGVRMLSTAPEHVGIEIHLD